MATDRVATVVTFLQLGGDRPICTGIRRSRVIAWWVVTFGMWKKE